MAIVKKPAEAAQTAPQEDGGTAVEKFISGAPDALASQPDTPSVVKRRQRPTKGSGKVQFGFTATRDMEKKIDDWCSENGMGITTLVTLALKEFFERHK